MLSEKADGKMAKWIEGKNCERVSECHSRNCNKKGNADFAVIGDDQNEYCSVECADDEKIEVQCE